MLRFERRPLRTEIRREAKTTSQHKTQGLSQGLETFSGITHFARLQTICKVGVDPSMRGCPLDQSCEAPWNTPDFQCENRAHASCGFGSGTGGGQTLGGPNLHQTKMKTFVSVAPHWKLWQMSQPQEIWQVGVKTVCPWCASVEVQMFSGSRW